MIFHMYRSKFLFYKKHHGILQQISLYLFIPIEMVYRAFVYSFIGLFVGKRRKESLLRINGYFKVCSRFILGQLGII